MITGILALLGAVAGIVLWFMKRRTPLQRDYEQIEIDRLRRNRDIDSWWSNRPPNA
jgi:hypothetical protein